MKYEILMKFGEILISQKGMIARSNSTILLRSQNRTKIWCDFSSRHFLAYKNKGPAILGEISAIFGAILHIAFWCRGTQKRRSPSINCLKGLSSATQAVIL
jgi:hypothetical protein